MRRFAMMVASVLAAACTGDSTSDRAAAPADSAPAWRIGVGGTSATLDGTTSYAELSQRFPGEVSDTMIHLGEAQFAPGTVVHAGDSVSRVEIVWLDSLRSRPWRIQLSGDTSRWSVGPGITLGTRLTELTRLNGRPFELTGFGWDYSGTVLGWDQGALEPVLLGGNGRVLLRLAPDSAAAASEAAQAVAGDGVFSSDQPEMQQLDPGVYQVIVEYDQPPAGP